MTTRQVSTALWLLIGVFGLAGPGCDSRPASETTGLAVSELGSADIVISQVYGGGGNSGSVYKNDFIEIFNRGTTAVNLSGWSVQYASSTGSSWSVTNLSGTIQPGHYYLIQEAAGSGGTTALPTPDATGSISMSATAGKVALVTNQTALTCGTSCVPNSAIRDFVGYGSAGSYEGTGPAPTLDNPSSDSRAGSGCTDTDNNSADFSKVTANPRNSASGGVSCGGGGTGGATSTGGAPATGGSKNTGGTTATGGTTDNRWDHGQLCPWHLHDRHQARFRLRPLRYENLQLGQLLLQHNLGLPVCQRGHFDLRPILQRRYRWCFQYRWRSKHWRRLCHRMACLHIRRCTNHDCGRYSPTRPELEAQSESSGHPEVAGQERHGTRCFA